MHFGKSARYSCRRVPRRVSKCAERDRLDSAIGARILNTDRLNSEREIRRYYRALYSAWGGQNWWPAETRFEVIVGAYLTQGTAWLNVERALGNLRAAGILTMARMREVGLRRLETLIRPSGYFRQKARRLKTFVAYLDAQHKGSIDELFSVPLALLREELLALNGVGPETADSILLYAGNYPVFVVDGYARRIFTRHQLIPETANYEEIRDAAEHALRPLGGLASRSTKPRSASGSAHTPSLMSEATRSPLAQIYNEAHALIVAAGKSHCGKSQPKCDGCPLQAFLPRGK